MKGGPESEEHRDDRIRSQRLYQNDLVAIKVVERLDGALIDAAAARFLVSANS